MGCVSSKKAVDKHSQLQLRQTGFSLPKGSKCFMYKQDPSVRGIGYRIVFIPEELKDGPSSGDIMITGLIDGARATDGVGNFLYNPNFTSQEFDAVHTFATVYQVLGMYRRAARRMGHTEQIGWHWGSEAISVYPRAGDWPNAFYSRDHKALAFYYFTPEHSQERIFTCRSFDIVAHETGHAILDGLKPKYIETDKAETGALHESFADLTCIFALLEQTDMCEAIVAATKCDLHDRNFLSEVGEQVGDAVGKKYGLRNLDDNIKLNDVSNEIHQLSQVFTGAVYDALVDMFYATLDLQKYSPAETLYRAGKHMCSVVLLAFLKSPDVDPTFAEVADKMIQVEPYLAMKTALRNEFEKRGIYDASARSRIASSDFAPGMSKCCGTLQAKADGNIKSVIEKTLGSRI